MLRENWREFWQTNSQMNPGRKEKDKRRNLARVGLRVRYLVRALDEADGD